MRVVWLASELVQWSPEPTLKLDAEKLPLTAAVPWMSPEVMCRAY